MSREIYGYWIGEDEIYEAEYEDHHGKAIEILRDVHGITEHTGYNAVCVCLFNMGYVRVTNHSYDEGWDVEYNGKVHHSKLQKEFIKDATRKDAVDGNRRRIEKEELA
jgi:hypothetical protein